jgi:hypothetical protein
MAATVKEILQDCIQQALSLPRDPIQTDIRDLALSAYNEEGRIIWDSWPWDNEKVDEFTAPTASSEGIITFASTVDVVRAIKGYDDSSDVDGTRIWNEDELIAAANGESVSTDRFQHLADSSTGCRRIKVATDNDSGVYKALCLKRWVDAIVDAAYSSTTPSATPTDYRVLTFAVDRAETALREQIKDKLRIYRGKPVRGLGDKLLKTAMNRDQLDSDRERRINPRCPQFSDVGSWNRGATFR